MVRRTRDALLTAGTVVSGDAVMAAIAADLTDGVLDGSGAGGVNPTISASAKVVYRTGTGGSPEQQPESRGCDCNGSYRSVHCYHASNGNLITDDR